MKWTTEAQHGLVDSSITMTAIIASQHRAKIARCIDGWYSSDKAIQKQRRSQIIDTIRENPAFHPQGVVLAVLQKQCGSFKNGND